MSSNRIVVLRPDFSFGRFENSTLRTAIASDLYPLNLDLDKPVCDDNTMNFMIDYYKDRELTNRMREFVRLNGHSRREAPIADQFGDLPGREYVYAVQDARWANIFLPAWYEREIFRKPYSEFFFETLPSSGFVSLAYLVPYKQHAAHICCPFITTVSEYDDSECAYFYGQYRENLDDRPDFGFWYTEDEDLIDQMRRFVHTLSDCRLDEDSLIF